MVGGGRGGFWGTSCQSAKKPAIYGTCRFLWVRFDVCNGCQFFRLCAMLWMMLAACRKCVTHERVLQHYRGCAQHNCQWRDGGTYESHTSVVVERRLWTKPSDIVDNSNHPLHHTLMEQSSSRSGRLTALRSRTEHHRRSFVPMATRGRWPMAMVLTQSTLPL